MWWPRPATWILRKLRWEGYDFRYSLVMLRARGEPGLLRETLFPYKTVIRKTTKNVMRSEPHEHVAREGQRPLGKPGWQPWHSVPGDSDLRLLSHSACCILLANKYEFCQNNPKKKLLKYFSSPTRNQPLGNMAEVILNHTCRYVRWQIRVWLLFRQ